jgi:hypothetical protein
MELIIECLRLLKAVLGAEHPQTLACSKTLNIWLAEL